MTTEDAIAKWSPFRDALSEGEGTRMASPCGLHLNSPSESAVPPQEEGGPPPPSALLALAEANFKIADEKIEEARPYFEMGQHYYELARKELDAD